MRPVQHTDAAQMGREKVRNSTGGLFAFRNYEGTLGHEWPLRRTAANRAEQG